jgi:hypothetical protein
MRHLGKKNIVWLSSGLAFAALAMTLKGADAASAGQHSAQQAAAHNGKSAAPAWRVWKSQTTANKYRARLEKDLFHAEWVDVPADWAKQGAYVRTECRRTGSKWVGTSESHLPCTKGEGASEQTMNWCDLKTRTEIDSISPDRITGHGESARKVDCQQCKILEAGWTAFVWTPAP